MGSNLFDLNAPPEEEGGYYVMLQKDNKNICRTKGFNLPSKGHSLWTILEYKPSMQYRELNWPTCKLYPEHENAHQKREWGFFLHYLWKKEKVAVVKFECCNFYILAPDEFPEFTHAIVVYETRKPCLASDNNKPPISENLAKKVGPNEHLPPIKQASTYTLNFGVLDSSEKRTINGEDSRHQSERKFIDSGCLNGKTSDDCDKQKNSPPTGNYSNGLKVRQSATDNELLEDVSSRSQPAQTTGGHTTNNFAKTHPNYLQTLSQTHTWIFGAIAELVDNARDANATRLDIKIESLYSRKAGSYIPVLSIVDDGSGMSHVDIVRMLSFGHEKPEVEDSDRIGRFGIGFKTGAMRLGKDAMVFTQSFKSRSVALLSQTYNENNQDLVIPIITYRKEGQYMEVDSTIQSEESARIYLDAIKEVSPFNEYFIGQRLGLFGEKKTGTQIYIWNLDKWGSGYSLEWGNENNVDNSTDGNRNDILIRSRRVRSRPGQISQKVPLDYSLHSYLEVIFLNPRMKIYVQGSLVKSCPLAKYLNKTVVVKGQVMGKPIQLTLGRNQLEWERVNCGIFLYWHGRLIEAYKRVGGTIYNADMGRGVIGVVDVTNIMDYSDGESWVLNNKQGFRDCEAYAILEEWLGNKTNEYWDESFDKIDLDRKRGNKTYKPDHEWVQCDSCRKWRMLTSGFPSESLPSDWFCQLPPFNGKCEMPEVQLEPGVVTVGTKRSGYPIEQNIQHKENRSRKAKMSKMSKLDIPKVAIKPVTNRSAFKEPCVSLKIENFFEDDSGVESLSSSTTEDDTVRPTLKRLRKGPTWSCKP